MENDSAFKTFVSAIWNGLKAPLICAVIMLAAAIVLISLQESKTAFDKKQNTTYQLVADPKLTPSDEVRVMPVDAFAEAVKKRVVSQGNGFLPGGVDAFSVVKKSAEEASHQSFKNRIELSAKLTEGINKQKNEWLKKTRESYDGALATEAGYDSLSARAIEQLNAKAQDGVVNVATIVKESKPETALSIALKDNKELSWRKDVSLPDVTSSVEKFYEEKKVHVIADRAALSRDISKTENSFQQLVSGVNEELRFQMQPTEEERTQPGTVLSLAAPTGPTNSTLSLILDEKQGLVGVYWLVRVALTGIVLFALLFLILIPLRHLFFWTASGEVLTEYVKKLLENKTSIVGPTVARAAMVTVAAATVAGGVAIAANALPFSKGPEPATSDDIARKVGDKLNKPGPIVTSGTPAPGDDPYDDIGTAPIVAGILSLAERMTKLENSVQGINVNPNVNTDVFDKAVSRFNERLGLPADTQASSSIFGKLNTLEGVQNSLSTRMDKVDGLIGSQNDQFPVKQSLFGRLNGVSETLGTRNTAFGPSLDPTSDPTVIESLRKLGTSTSTDNTTLFGRMSSVDKSVDNVFKTAGSIRRDQLGSGGRNLFTQSKTLFSPERYRVSQSAFDEIARELNGQYAGLHNNLKNLVDDSKAYSADELRTKLGPLPNGWWDKWKSTIFRYTRVARY